MGVDPWPWWRRWPLACWPQLEERFKVM